MARCKCREVGDDRYAQVWLWGLISKHARLGTGVEWGEAGVGLKGSVVRCRYVGRGDEWEVEVELK